jgi:hypothetical protein
MHSACASISPHFHMFAVPNPPPCWQISRYDGHFPSWRIPSLGLRVLNPRGVKSRSHGVGVGCLPRTAIENFYHSQRPERSRIHYEVQREEVIQNGASSVDIILPLFGVRCPYLCQISCSWDSFVLSREPTPPPRNFDMALSPPTENKPGTVSRKERVCVCLVEW